MAKILFFHGTGRQNHDANKAQIEDHRDVLWGFEDAEVVAVRWLDGVNDGVELPYLDVQRVMPDWEISGLEVLDTLDPEIVWSEFSEQLEVDDDEVGPAELDLPAHAGTRWFRNRRLVTMRAASVFLQSVVVFARHVDAVEEAVMNAIREHKDEDKLLILGHSLGGMAAADVLSTPGVDLEGANIKMLVTAGSQTSWMYLMHGLHGMKPALGPANRPFSPWLNIYDTDDFIGFPICGVWPADANDWRVDVGIDSGEPFYKSHTQYFGNGEFYQEVGDRLRDLYPKALPQ